MFSVVISNPPVQSFLTQYETDAVLQMLKYYAFSFRGLLLRNQ